MSKYTITIKNLIDNGFDFKMTDYPIFDEEYRDTLNQNILNHYYEEEIGLETPALFRHYLNTRLNIIMPKYNILYNAQKEYALNVFNNVNLREELTRTADSASATQSSSTSSGSTTSTATTSGKNLFQDTPQGRITQTDIDAQTWASNVTFDVTKNNGGNQSSSSITDNSSGSGSANEHYVKTLIGVDKGQYGDAYKKIVSNIVSIDELIINELADLFMGIY